MDCNSPGSSVHGILQARILECQALLQAIFPTQGLNPPLLHLTHWQAGSLPLAPPGKPSFIMKVKVKSLSPVRLFATPWTVAYQAPPSMGFSRQEYWSGLRFPSPLFYRNSWLKPTEQVYGLARSVASAVCLKSRPLHAQGLSPRAMSTYGSYEELASEESGGSAFPGLGEQAFQPHRMCLLTCFLSKESILILSKRGRQTPDSQIKENSPVKRRDRHVRTLETCSLNSDSSNRMPCVTDQIVKSMSWQEPFRLL